jgi:hypothetical protein
LILLELLLPKQGNQL